MIFCSQKAKSKKLLKAVMYIGTLRHTCMPYPLFFSSPDPQLSVHSTSHQHALKVFDSNYPIQAHRVNLTLNDPACQQLTSVNLRKLHKAIRDSLSFCMGRYSYNPESKIDMQALLWNSHHGAKQSTKVIITNKWGLTLLGVLLSIIVPFTN